METIKRSVVARFCGRGKGGMNRWNIEKFKGSEKYSE